MKNIIFIGDSFCASMSRTHFQKNGYQRGQAIGEVAHPSIVADTFDAQLNNYGYGGKSWWYSYEKFNKDKIKILTDNTIAIIFFHTDSARINSTNPNWTNNLKFMNEEYQHLYKEWLAYMYEIKFQEWVHRSYFKELRELYSDIKTIHFNCFRESTQYCNILPGMVYRTPLHKISESEVNMNWDNDSRANHFNDINNLALSRVIINSINNYQPGLYDIDVSTFDLNTDNIKFGYTSTKKEELLHPETIKDYITLMKEKGLLK